MDYVWNVRAYLEGEAATEASVYLLAKLSANKTCETFRVKVISSVTMFMKIGTEN